MSDTEETWVPLADIPLTTGLLALGDVQSFDEHWTKRWDAHGAWVLDITGPDAEFFAKRVSHVYEKVQLADGTYRVLVPNNQVAVMHRDEAVRLVKETDKEAEFYAAPRNTSSLRVMDATRETGAGAYVLESGVVVGAQSKGHGGQRPTAPVMARIVDGRVVELRIKLA